jgi:5-formyltetrahydrofolate cyclo-ligase
VTVPITYVKEKRLDAILIRDVSKDLVPGYCGILEPEKNLCMSRVVKPGDIDVIILPGSVFDERGGRFGYGGGYYDRFLESNPKAVRIGLAFELQTVTEAPIKAHDELLDYIITEKRIIKGKR